MARARPVVAGLPELHGFLKGVEGDHLEAQLGGVLLEEIGRAGKNGEKTPLCFKNGNWKMDLFTTFPFYYCGYGNMKLKKRPGYSMKHFGFFLKFLMAPF